MKSKRFGFAAILLFVLISLMIILAFFRTDKRSIEHREAGIINLIDFLDIEEINNYIDVENAIEECMNDGYLICAAKSTGDASYCDYAKDSMLCKDEFDLYLLFYKDRNISCNEFNTPKYKKICSMYLLDYHKRMDALECKNLGDIQDEEMCRAWILEDPAPCVEVGEEECQDQIYQKRAFMSNNISFCNRLSSKISKGVCLAVLRGNTTFCKALIEGCIESYMDPRLFELATNEGKIEICNKIKSGDLKKSCIKTITAALFELATNEGKIEICDKIQSADMKKSCISAINLDLKNCRAVKDQYAKFRCLIHLGEFLNKPGVCQELEDEKLSKGCEEYFSFI